MKYPAIFMFSVLISIVILASNIDNYWAILPVFGAFGINTWSKEE